MRLNSGCASLVIHHRPDFTPTRDLLDRALTPILMPAASVAPPPPKVSRRAERSRARPEKTRVRVEAPKKRASGQALAACPICQLKLKAARWILTDFWRCWRDHWTQRLHGRLLASVALFRP
ncbi:hypothetical protein D779_2888 [Imhoffiella purpurea]|uniref:Uncharacterized protein n=1 Tax=Imhoffiella purpurea TaxID=1249627 RepID=W9VDU5_9GAMM|nr:hypothetical protein D779_2888 [Imhoffiella purpurea]